MNEENKKFEIRVDGTPPHTAFICIPIEVYAEDQENGMALLHGKMREAEANLAKLLVDLRRRKMAINPSIIGADGRPMATA